MRPTRLAWCWAQSLALPVESRKYQLGTADRCTFVYHETWSLIAKL